MNTLVKSGGAWLVPPSLVSAALRRIRVSGFATSSSSSLPNWEGGVSMVQGASRGIGLEFVRQLLEKYAKGYVVATCRNPKEATSLSDLKNRYSERLFIQKLDVTDETTIEESAESVREKYGSLNLLINAAGILSIPGVLQPGMSNNQITSPLLKLPSVLSATRLSNQTYEKLLSSLNLFFHVDLNIETTLNKVEKSSLMLAYEVNAVGPILVMKHMWPLLKAGGGTGTDREVAVVANLSARVGSIGDNRLGGWHSYRASKSALNQLTKNVSVELGRKKDPVTCILLHPGTVDTDLSRPFQKNVPEGKLFTREYSVQKLLHIINNAKKQDNGKFFAWDGEEIPW